MNVKIFFLMFLCMVLIACTGEDIAGKALGKNRKYEQVGEDRILAFTPEKVDSYFPKESVTPQRSMLITGIQRGEWVREIPGDDNWRWNPGPLRITLSDINNDGFQEIIFPTSGVVQRVYVLDHEGNDLPNFPIELPDCNPGLGIPGGNLGVLAVKDIDGDSFDDILVINPLDDNHIYAFNHLGQAIDGFPFELPYYEGVYPTPYFFPAVVLEDLDGDGEIEIIAFDSWPGVIAVYNSDLNMIDGFPVFFYQNVGTLTQTVPAFANLDNSPELEMIFVRSTQEGGGELHRDFIEVYDMQGNMESWGEVPSEIYSHQLTLGDIDDDDLVDVVAGYRVPGGLYAYDNEGNIKPNFPVLEQINLYEAPLLTNIGAGDDLMIFTSKMDAAYVVDKEGNVVSEWDKEAGAGFYAVSGSQGVSVKDADGMVYIFSISGDRIYGWNENGDLVEGFPKEVNGDASLCSIAVGDIDNDEMYELVVGSERNYPDFGYISYWDTNINIYNVEWGMQHFNGAKIGYYKEVSCEDGTPYGECSLTKPKFCEDGQLIDRCSVCGCKEGMFCTRFETCSKYQVAEDKK